MNHYWKKLRDKNALKRALRYRFFRLLNMLFVLPIAMMIAGVIVLLRPFVDIRLHRLVSDRIGHYALNTELFLCFLKQTQLEHIKKKKIYFYLICSKISNEQLHKMWKRNIFILPFPHLFTQVDGILIKFLGEKYLDRDLYEVEQNRDRDIIGLLKKTSPSIQFTDHEEKFGQLCLRQLGILEHHKFVCILVRDSAYLNKHTPETNWHYHDFRDADINDYTQAALYLAEQGYYVIRMGKWMAEAWNVQHPKVIDYAMLEETRSDFMDIYLSAKCEFFISTSSGLDAVPQLFRRPVMFADVPPLATLLQYSYPCKIFIPKKIAYADTGKLLTFHEIQNIFAHATPRNVHEYLIRHNLVMQNNTADEILAAVQEMQERIKGSWHEEQKAQMLQEKFWKVFPQCMIANWYKVAAEVPEIKIGAAFVQAYQHLM